MKLYENILNDFQVIEGHKIAIVKFQRGITQKKCTEKKSNGSCALLLSDDVVYFYEVVLKCLKRFPSYRVDTKLPLSNFKGE